MSALPHWTCLALVGPTASGKSNLAMALAKRWPIEIISMDSALVYQGMDIGSAKPSAADLSRQYLDRADSRKTSFTSVGGRHNALLQGPE